MSDNDREKKPCYKNIGWVVSIAIIIGIVLVLLELFILSHTHSYSLAYLTAALVVVTGLLAYVAYNELSHLSKISEKSEKQLKELSIIAKTDFLMRIDHRYCSKEMVDARTIIHNLYHKVKADHEAKSDPKLKDEKLSTSRHRILIGQAIEKLRLKSGKEGRDFILLVNFLDFLETVSYLANKKEHHIETTDIEALLGGSIVYYCEVFSPLIQYRRNKYNRPKWYCEIQKLCVRIGCECSISTDKNTEGKGKSSADD